jgi:hypothetical protein
MATQWTSKLSAKLNVLTAGENSDLPGRMRLGTVKIDFVEKEIVLTVEPMFRCPS